MKRNLRYLIIIAYVVFFIIFILSGCNTIQFDNCPYLITEQYVSYDTECESFSYAGAFFSVLNNSNKTISNLTICFSLFDEDGNIIGFGNSQYRTTFEGEITEGARQEIVISLDNILGNTNESNCRIDFAYVSSISYKDGTVWQDYIGLYSL